MIKKNIIKMSVFIIFGTLIALKIQAQVLFEGYSKITLGEQFIGFTIQRYEFDAQKKNFISTSLIKYNEIGGSITESLKAFANEALEPISYSYNLLSPSGVKTIDATFTKGVLSVKTTEKGITRKKDLKLPKGSFFSSFLAYVILKNPHGLKKSSKYEYQAVAEEDGENYKGTATVQSEETYKGLHVYKILNDYKGSQFISYTTDKGEMITTLAPQKSLSLELVTEPSLAVGDLSVGADNLKLLFGNIPEGKINALSMGLAPNPTLVKSPVANKPSGASTSLTPATGVVGSNTSSTPTTSSAATLSTPTPTPTTVSTSATTNTATTESDSTSANSGVASPSSSSTKLKKLEPKFPKNTKEKKGIRPGLGIQTKSDQ